MLSSCIVFQITRTASCFGTCSGSSMLRAFSRTELELLQLELYQCPANKSINVYTKEQICVAYQAGYDQGDDCLLDFGAVSEASSFVFADALLFPREYSSLVFCYFCTAGWDCKISFQVLEASVADIVLVVVSISAINKKSCIFFKQEMKNILFSVDTFLEVTGPIWSFTLTVLQVTLTLLVIAS